MLFQELESEIEEIRTKMISIGMEEGLKSPKTIIISQKLDQLINIWMEMKQE